MTLPASPLCLESPSYKCLNNELAYSQSGIMWHSPPKVLPLTGTGPLAVSLLPLWQPRAQRRAGLVTDRWPAFISVGFKRQKFSKKDTTGPLVKHKKPHVNLIFFFNVHHFLNLFWICYTVLLLYYVLSFWLQAMWDLSFPDQGTKRRSLQWKGAGS